MVRKQGPEEKYYPQVWRFLRRCTSPLMTPREGNTFASRNGLSNRFSHMDQPQSLRHRCARITGDKRDDQHACGYRPERAVGSGETSGPAPGQRCHSPSRRRSRAESPDSPTGAERGLKILKRQRIWWNIASGVSSPAELFSHPKQSPGQKKRNPRPCGRFLNTHHFLGAIIGAFKPNVE